MRISVWSSDVCSSDLIPGDRYRSVSATQPILGAGGPADGRPTMTKAVHCDGDRSCFDVLEGLGQFGREFGIFGAETADRKSVVSGKSVSVRVDLGGRRIIKKTRGKTIIIDRVLQLNTIR